MLRFFLNDMYYQHYSVDLLLPVNYVPYLYFFRLVVVVVVVSVVIFTHLLRFKLIMC